MISLFIAAPLLAPPRKLIALTYNSDDPSERLSAVRAAIAKCLNAEAYTVGEQKVQRARLQELRAMERELMQEVTQQNTNGGSMMTLGQFHPGR